MSVNARRSRGRPPQTDEQRAATRTRILAAAGAVYAEYGYRGTTVARIAERAELSKPTFYTFFDGVAEAITALVTESQQQMLAQWEPVANVGGDLVEQVSAGLDTYLQTAERGRDSWLVFHVEQNDPSSPARRLRTAYEKRLIEVMRQALAASGRPAPTAETLAVLMASMQAGCYRYLSTPEAGRPAVRAAMLRSALALVGTPQDWRDVAERPDLFDEG
ncbi:TetR/AcrR family transcriptional regulator [Mycobacteroides saopaulense]|uniref:TetR family transcriptional regulator n=1 Tax=Mycobacteroides saopaulense TaxID=1578165 RepID=A0A1X0JC03_9MYCO|nr:TetR/AcrR family transcriptional regulator [Mycobacteroides saopaulense]OHT88909.1 TetR family transcriptional regulator [Mycobacteroides saopaulense]OHU13729.1 TetR family transcriptional regulator [Mycobacteroides saopaulense]ORB60251.1 TetR family transcriptional regulator [Mycobacteroides saopaulense]